MQAASTITGLRFLEIFGAGLRRRTILASMLAAGGLGGNYVTLTWLATYLRTVRNLSVLGTGAYLGFNIFGSFLGYVISAHLSGLARATQDVRHHGVRRAVVVPSYTLLPLAAPPRCCSGFSSVLSVGDHCRDGRHVCGAVPDARAGNRPGVLV